MSGAVRRSAVAPVRPRRVRHLRTACGALVLATTGILAATTGTEAGTGEDDERIPDEAAPTVVAFAEPAFFFDDAADAVADRLARRQAKAADARPAAAALPDAASPSPATRTASLAPPPDEGARAPAPPTAALPGHGPRDDRDPVYPAPTVDDPPALAALKTRAAAPAGAIETEVVVGPGDTLSGILNDRGVRIEQMPALLTDEVVGTHLSRLEVGQTFAVTQRADGRFHSLSAKIGHDTRVTIRRTDEGFAVAAIDLPIEKERVVTSGTIEQSLYLAAEQAELKQSTIMTLADIFQWELDFARDIRRGDHFAVVYDRLYREGKYIGDGDVLAAEFERGGRTYRAIRFTDDGGRSGYYAPDGTSKRRTFLRHPVDVVRITSKFDPNRLHPVLHQIRAHRGVDYGAPHGSPVRATADGVVRFADDKSSYGKTVILQHGGTIQTLYAHLSRISDKSVTGARVRQGDVIGYVGNTGRVTGTHLHYEFRVGGTHVDPLAVEFPAAAPLPLERRDALRAVSDELIAQMRSVLPGADGDRVVADASAAGSPTGVHAARVGAAASASGSALAR